MNRPVAGDERRQRAAVTVDPAGRVTGLAGSTLTFDKQNDLRSVRRSSGTESYAYDATLRRLDASLEGRRNTTSTMGTTSSRSVNSAGADDGQYLYDGVDSPLRLMRRQNAVLLRARPRGERAAAA